MLPAYLMCSACTDSGKSGRCNLERTTMKANLIQAAAVASVFVSIAFTATTVRAEHRCDNPTGVIDPRACAKAAEGPDTLRNFVLRTRTIWSLYYWDYARNGEQGAAGSTAAQPASLRTADSKK